MTEKKKLSRKFRPNYFYSIVSTALVLFMIGILAFVLSGGRELTTHFKEDVEFQVIIKDNVKEKKVMDLKAELEKEPWVKNAVYVSKEDAAEQFIQETGEDFNDLLGFNPLYASINLNVPAEYFIKDTLSVIEEKITAHSEVSEFYYDRKLVDMLNDKLSKVGWIIIGISLMLLIIAVSLIDSTIRLSMYANRFLIRSMQLVGATRGFITGPFLRKGLTNGAIAALIAMVVLFVLMRFATSQIPDLSILQDPKVATSIYGGMLLFGLLFSLISTRLAVGKYLRMKIDELY